MYFTYDPIHAFYKKPNCKKVSVATELIRIGAYFECKRKLYVTKTKLVPWFREAAVAATVPVFVPKCWVPDLGRCEGYASFLPRVIILL